MTPRLSWKLKVAGTRLNLHRHEYQSDRHGPQFWFEGYAVGPEGMVAVYAQNEGQGCFAQFRKVERGVEWCYRLAWPFPVNQRAIALAAGKVLRGEVYRTRAA